MARESTQHKLDRVRSPRVQITYDVETGSGVFKAELPFVVGVLADLAGHRATLLQGPRFVGTGTEVADQMEEWMEADACDGFVIAATHSPGAYEDVVRLVVPELQRRGRFRHRYTGATLRDTLGLARPDATPHG